MRWKVPIFLLGVSILGFAQANAYELAINNQAVVFTFINITCNGGRIDKPPRSIPVSPPETRFEVQSDKQQGCMLRYEDSRYNILGIWIHGGQVECSHAGGLLSYNCTYYNQELTIK